MKVYDTISHRSVELDPKAVNITKTKNSPDEILLHPKKGDGNLVYCIPTTHKTWNKICTVPRKNW